MSISNSKKNVFYPGPYLELCGSDLIITKPRSKTQLDFAAATGIVISEREPYLHPVELGLFKKSQFQLRSWVTITTLGSYDPITVLVKDLNSKAGTILEMQAISKEFNELHDRVKALCDNVYANLTYTWEAVRDRSDISQTELKEFDALQTISGESIKIPDGIKSPKFSGLKELVSQLR